LNANNPFSDSGKYFFEYDALALGLGGASVLEMKMGFLGLWWLDLPAQAGVKPRLIVVKFKKNSVEIVSPRF
jgi:hypothetical protein